MTETKNVQSSPALEAGRYFRHMADFVGFGEEEAKTGGGNSLESHCTLLQCCFQQL